MRSSNRSVTRVTGVQLGRLRSFWPVRSVLWSRKWQSNLIFIAAAPVGGTSYEDSLHEERTRRGSCARRSSTWAMEEFVREMFLCFWRSFGINPSWYHPAFGEEKEPPCLTRRGERPRHLEEEEVPARSGCLRGLVDGLLIAGPAHGFVTSSLDTTVTDSHLEPGFFKGAALHRVLRPSCAS